MREFISKAELREWLKGKPRSWAQAIASRVSLRVLPAVTQIIDSKFVRATDQERMILAVLRANFVSASALSHPNDPRVSSAASAAAAAAASACGKVHSSAAYAAAAAAAAANAVDFGASAANAAEAANNTVGMFSEIWSSISSDAAWLEMTSGLSASERGVLLLQQPLWTSKIPEFYQSSWNRFASSPFVSAHDFEPWIKWYETLGPFDFGNLPHKIFSNSLTLRIASQPDIWWRQSANVINADIARWMLEDRSVDDDSNLQDRIVQALDELPVQQPAPYLFDWRDGRMEVLPPDALPEDGGIAQDYLDETREKANDLLEALARSNTDPTIARKVGKLRKVLTERAADLRPALVDSRCISVERHAKSLDNPQDAAEIPARILADLGDLADTARRLCNCLPALWQRDVERLANSLTPDSATELLHQLDALRDGIKDADIIGPDVQAAFDTLSEDSAEPDADDVRRRRIAMFGLTARNLLTTLLRASKGSATELVRFAKDIRKELRPELVKGTAKLIIGTGVSITAAYLFVALLGPTSGIAKFFPEIERVTRILEALKAGEGKPPTPPAGSEPPLSPRTPRPTAERGPTRSA